MTPGDVIIVRRYPGPRGRAGEIAPSESYARVVDTECAAVTVDVCGVYRRVSPERTRRAPKAVQP